MNHPFMTYGNSFISYADAWESLLATLTPPVKTLIIKQLTVAIRLIVIFSVTTWHIVCPVRDAFFACKFLNIK